MADDPQAAALADLRRQVTALEQQLAEAETGRAAARVAELAEQARIALDQRLVDEALLLTLAAARAAASLPKPPLAVAQIVRRVLEQLPPQRSLTDKSIANISFAWHPDSRRLAVSTGDSLTTPSQLTLWDVTTGECQVRLEGDAVSYASHQEIDAVQIDTDLRGVDPRRYLWDIELLRWSPDGRTLLIGRHDSTALLWDPDAEAPHRGLPGPQLVTVPRQADREQDEPPAPAAGASRTGSQALQWKIGSLAWSDNGARLLIIYEARDEARDRRGFTARLWDAATGALLAELAPTEPHITCMAASPDAQAVAVGDREGRIRILDAATGTLRRELMSPSEFVSLLAWSTDSTQLLSSDAPYPALYDPLTRTQIWDTRSGALIENLTGVIPAQPWSPDGQSVVTIEGEAVLWFWESATGTRRAAFAWDRCSGVFWSPDSQFLLVTTEAGVSLWELPNIHVHYQLVENPGWFADVAWSPDGRRLAGTDGDTLRVYDLLRWQPARPLPAHRPPIFKRIPPARAFGADWTAAGPRLVVQSAPDELPQFQAWDLAGPIGPPLTLNGEAADYIYARWHPQGRTVLLRAEADRQRTPWFGRPLHWEVATGATRELRSDVPLVDAQWSPDGDRYALLAADGEVQIRDAATDALLERLPAEGHGVFRIIWNPDGSALLRLQITVDAEPPDEGARGLRVLATVHGAQPLRWELHLDHQSIILGAGWGPGGPQLLVEHPVPNVSEVWQENIHRGLTMWDLGQGTVQWQTINPILSSGQATWSPDGRQILLNSGFRQAMIDAATGAVLEIFERNVVSGMEWDLEGMPIECWRPDSREFFSIPLGAEWEPTRRCQFIVGRDLLEAELTRRVCERLGDSMGEANLDAHLRALIPGWRGARVEMAAIVEQLAEYDRICTESNGRRS